MQRIGKNLGGYFGEQINIQNILQEAEAAARQHGWTSESFHATGEQKWLAFRRAAPRSTFRVYISTGIHGDEPAGPLAALQLLGDDQWPDDAEIVLLPCLNPVGFVSNQREN